LRADADEDRAHIAKAPTQVRHREQRLLLVLLRAEMGHVHHDRRSLGKPEAGA
jgi:hypothetical protein